MRQTYYTRKPDTENRFQCRHVFTDGHRCQSPALRQENFCYYHHTTRKPVPKQELAKRKSRRATLHIPLPEDRSAIQHSIGQVLQLLGSNELDTKRAGLLLYGLQIASQNLPKPNPKAYPWPTVDEITEDGLAPVAEFREDNQPKSEAERMVEEWISGRDEHSQTQPANLSEPNHPAGSGPTTSPNEEPCSPTQMSAQASGVVPDIQAVAASLTRKDSRKQKDRPSGRPAALSTHWKATYLDINGRGERIRTSDPLVPNQVRYQTALRPEPLVVNIGFD